MWPLAELPYGQEEVENGCGGTARHLTEYFTGTRVHCSLYWTNSGESTDQFGLAFQKLILSDFSN